MATGQTSSITFGTSGITLNEVEIDPMEESVEDIAEPHLGLAVGSNIPYSPGDLVEGGELRLTLEGDIDTQISTRVVETITWTKPIPSGSVSGRTRAFSGYIKSSKESPYATSQRLLYELVIKVAGDVTDTAAA